MRQSDPGRIRVQLRGAVQGVGMRPFVHRLAQECGVAGFVRNGAGGVTIEAEGGDLQRFLARLEAAPPPLARISALEIAAMPRQGGAGFAIAASSLGPPATHLVADAAPCDACRADLFNPASRFFAYPFVTCPDCGPRHSIAHGLPYDRARTAMADFPPCTACAADYANPANRRFHAETIACPACGPRLSHEIPAIAARLRDGDIVALKGIGGFHLLCDAGNEAAVAELRRRKARPAKPFAVMLADADQLARIAAPDAAEHALAAASARPIVLMTAREGALAPSVAPGLARIGVMLAHAPVHHLLFAALPPGFALVASSANRHGEPLVIDNDVARRDLAGIADLVVTHDRTVVVRLDDSVAQIIAGAPALLRRARGVVPEPVALAADGPCVLALGAQRKNTVTLTRGNEAFVSQHFGDLDNATSLRAWREGIAQLLRLLDVRPERVVADLHPDDRAGSMAEEFGPPVLRVQHHAAHIAAIAAEHRLTIPVLGLALDGHGMGSDGGAWGGEVLFLHGAAWRRLGGLGTLALPGNDLAAREPWRMGVAALHCIGLGHEAAARFPDQTLAAALAARLAAGAAMARTSSLGRWFDAAAALLGLCRVQFHEGQAAMELEALVGHPAMLPGGWTLDGMQLDFAPLLRALAAMDDARQGAALFHGTVIDGLVALAARAAAATGVTTICLGGGCLMNRVLAEGLAAGLLARNLHPVLARSVPANDGGLSLGQAALARALMLEGN